MNFNPLAVMEENHEHGRHIDYKGVRRRAYGAKSKTAKFIAVDGEGIMMPDTPLHHTSGLWIRNGLIHEEDGSLIEFTAEPQPYVLLSYGDAQGNGDRITSEEGLSTYDCFEFLLTAKQKNPNSIFVGFGFNYDVNQMLSSWDSGNNKGWLYQLYKNNEVRAGNYYVKWFPRKFFNITQFRPAPKRSVIIYDTFGFFQSSFLEACRKYLGDDDLTLIERGKEARSVFEWKDLDKFIIPYNNMELEMLCRMMDILRQDLAKVGVYPSQWYGPGAVTDKVLKQHGIKVAREFHTIIPKGVLPRVEGVNRAAQFAMAGGRFEHYALGHYRNTVYEADIHSAYPSACSEVPDLTDGYWDHVRQFEPDSFGVWYIDYSAPYGVGRTSRPQPLFCRAEHGNISYPYEVQGWYWTPEATLCPDFVREGFVFRPRSTTRPFRFIHDMYRDRMDYKAVGNSAERALKLILASSFYGKFAQTVGGKKIHPKDDCLPQISHPVTGRLLPQPCPHLKPPTWHQLEYAGYITSSCRAKVYRAMMLDPTAVIAAETDAVFSTRPLDLDYGDGLGQWELKEYSSIVYLQNGFYYAVTDDDPEPDTPIEATALNGKAIKCRFRGLDTDRATKQPIGLPYRQVLDHLSHFVQPLARKTPALRSTSRRYIGLGLKFQSTSTWRSWEDVPKAVSLDGNGGSSKRVHIRPYCPECQAGHTLNDCLHPLTIGGYSGKSYPRNLPWDDELHELEMDDSERDRSWEIEKFQP